MLPMKILHSADWHLDSPLQGRTPEQTGLLRRALLRIPGQVAQVCMAEQCDMMLLSGDLFDGPFSLESYQAVYGALKAVNVPVFIAPGNHDFVGNESPWRTKSWPENVYIFKKPVMEQVTLEDLSCRVYGAGFTSMDCPGLLEGFRAEPGTAWSVGVLHGDPTQVNTPYCPVTKNQVKASGLDYLALGHIHKGGSFEGGKTLCAWPGCPMGRGYDEQGEKGVLIVTLEERASARFVPLDTPRFYDLQVDAQEDAGDSMMSVLPAVGNQDFYRITLTGPSNAIDLSALAGRFSQFPNLELRDHTTPPVDVWSSAGEDSFEGTYFQLLRNALEDADEQTRRQIQLAARISRQILDGQEVQLP